MRVAYADPPYIGQAEKHYSDDPKCAEVDHRELIAELNTYDAWALSLSSVSLRQILNMCPDDVRVGMWIKSFAFFKPNVNPGYCYEPVIFRGGRKRKRSEPTVRDYVICPVTTKQGVHGAKPPGFCYWVLDFLNVKPCDSFCDIFLGSGNMTRAYQRRVLQRETSEQASLWEAS